MNRLTTKTRVQHMRHMPYDDILRLIVDGMVSFPKNVEIQSKPTLKGHMLSIRTHSSDHGRIMGTGGANIDALQNILRAVARQRNETILLSMEKPIVGDNQFSGLPFTEDPEWNRDNEILAILHQVCSQLTREPKTKVTSLGKNTTLSLANDIDPITQSALARIFKAWGKTNGRKIFFECGLPHVQH